MKKIYLFILLIPFLTGCEKLFDLSPVDKMTPETVFNSEKGLELYTNSFYAATQIMPQADQVYKDVFSSDNMSDYGAVSSINVYIQNGFESNQTSGWDWGPLRNINYFLENFNNPSISQEARDHYQGLARFFRAWFYFNMVKKFGDVPWYSNTLADDDPAIYKARDPRTLVMDSVLADLDFACENLRVAKNTSSSRITRNVALAMKSRICLFEGSIRKYHPQLNLKDQADIWFTRAADAAEKVMNSGMYKLRNTGNSASDYRSLFISENPQTDEVMLATVYNNSLRRWHSANWWFTSATYGSRWSLTKSFINSYPMLDGTRFTEQPGFETMTFMQETQNRDKRLGQTIRLAGYKRSNGTAAAPDFGYTTTGYQPIKYTLDDSGLDGKAENYNSIPLIRYAEVLLNYAEAMAELNTFGSSVWDKTIRLLRQRAGITKADMPTTMDSYYQREFFPGLQSTALVEIRKERAIELVAEGFRYDDLVRWKAGYLLEKPFVGMYVPAMNTLMDLNSDGKPDVSFVTSRPSNTVSGVIYYIINGGSSQLSEGTKGNLIWLSNVKKVFDEKRYFYPIPLDQVVLSGDKVKQNLGWQPSN
ncbi:MULTISPECIES: RagB/SusD family nutrient uptake outer membrane protein [Sphingobacterium]|uniref:RagB/SusD family nutrient uptake outer membrane protein n=1 Tax=Sphingobacterium TaxID=28453 RepID=UPI00257F889A|nr:MULTISPECIES: RagB/SusD family nutrient uptake outer membrane protein [Sphingobacterium]